MNSIALDFSSMFKDNVEYKNIDNKFVDNENKENNDLNKLEEIKLELINEENKIQWIIEQLYLNNINSNKKEIEECKIGNILFNLISEVFFIDYIL